MNSKKFVTMLKKKEEEKHIKKSFQINKFDIWTTS